MKFPGMSLTVAAALLAPAAVPQQNTPKAAEAGGIARIERVRDQVRRSGFQPSLLNELTIAEKELQTSYRAFQATSNQSGTAESLVGMGDAERLARIFILATAQNGNLDQQAEALARSARSHYQEAAVLARKAGSATSLVKALTGMALLDESQERDYGAANSRVTEALRVAASCPNQDCTLDALQFKVEVETYRGELFSAGSHANGVVELLKNRTDPNRQYSAYMDRSAIYRAMSVISLLAAASLSI